MTTSGTTRAGGQIGLTGTTNATNWTPTPQQNQPAQGDPFASLPFLGDCSATPTPNGGTGTRTLNPGTYSSLTVSSGNTLTLNPGVYTLTGNLSNGGGTINGDGVTFYFCGSAKLDLSSNNNGVTNLSAPGGASGLLFFFDRANTADALDFNNNNTGVRANLTGIIYAPNARLYSTGGSAAVYNITGDVVVGRIYWSGAHVLNIMRGPETFGSLEVTKTVDGPAAADRGTVTIRVECGGIALTPDFVIAPGAPNPDSKTYTDIPTGQQCTVSEIEDGSTSTVTTTITGDNQTATIGAGTTSTVGLTDTYDFAAGSLRVTKLITGDAAGHQGAITIAVSCTGGSAPFSGGVTIPAGTPTPQPFLHIFSPIPAGSACTITEPATGAIAGTVSVSTTGVPQTVTVGAGEAVNAGQITDTYSFEPGSLTVSKTLTGPAAADRGPVTIRVTCDGTALTPDFVIGPTAPSPASHTYTGIPAGQTCTVSEIADGSTDAVSVNITGDDKTVTIQPGTGSTVNLTDTYDFRPGSLTVSKLIAGEAAGHQGAITIAVSCTGGSAPFSGSVTIPAGATTPEPFLHTFSPIPGNSTCTITEPATGAIAGTVTVSTTGVPQTVPVPGGGDVQAGQITDTYSFEPGSLAVKKTITGSAAGRQGQIIIRVVCDGTTLSPDFVIGTGATGTESHTYPNIPAGQKCTVTEIADGHTSSVDVTVQGSGQVVTISPGTAATAALSDTVEPAPPGSLLVTKTITGRAAGHQGAVTISVACTLNGGTSFTGSFTVAADSVAGDYTHLFQRIPAGSSCTVTETADGVIPGTVTVTTQNSPQTVDIPASSGAQTAPVIDTYTFVPGQLTVTKAITGPAAGRQGQVTVRTFCDGVALTPDLIIGPGSPTGTSVTYTGVPGNATCLFTEIQDGSTPNVSVSIAGDDERVVIPPGGSNSHTITDTYEPIPGALVVSKLIAGGAAGHQGAITVDVACTLDGSPGFTGSFTIGATTTTPEPFLHTFSPIPSGSICTVTEPTDGSIPGTVTATVSISPQPVTIPPNGSELVGIIDQYEFVPGQLTVTKAIAGPAAGRQGQIVLHTVCDGVALTPDLIIGPGSPTGASVTYTGVPGNASCLITEIADGATSAVSVSIAGDNQRVVITPGGSDSATLTDTYAPTPTTLTVRKLVGGQALGQQGPVTISVACTLNGAPSFSGSFTIPAGTTGPVAVHEFDSIPNGSACTVTETGEGSTTTVLVTVIPGSPQTVQIPAPPATAFTELADLYDFTPGSLTVSKTLTGPLAGQQGTIRIQTVCDGLPQAPDLVIQPGAPAGTESLTYPSIHGTASCTVSETSNGGTDTVQVVMEGSGQVHTIPPNGMATAVLTDAFDPVGAPVAPPPTGLGHPLEWLLRVSLSAIVAGLVLVGTSGRRRRRRA